MSYFVIQIKTRCEEKFLKRANSVVEIENGSLIWPRRNLKIRRQGAWKDSLAPIFPGYVFLDVGHVSTELYLKMKKIPGFSRFLQSNQNIMPLSGSDKELLSHFISFGEIVDKSIVLFDENNRIKVVSGPMKGIEGLIVKVDRRKGRAKIRLDMFKSSFLIDFGFEALDNI
ncbi:MAG: antiterminator LoaP [Spirochaetes bacterium]|nr:antiterminator LoaP [Spirochaetota bacterium]